jgi:hypothetical protein
MSAAGVSAIFARKHPKRIDCLNHLLWISQSIGVPGLKYVRGIIEGRTVSKLKQSNDGKWLLVAMGRPVRRRQS